MWKKAGLGLLVLIVGFLGYVATRPAEFSISRKKTIQAPPGVVYMFVYDFHNWPRWSPWEKLDLNMKKTFSGAEKGQGAVYAWQGNDQVGEGRMTIEKASNGAQVEIKLEFLKPWTATNDTVFNFAKSSEGTLVTWTMSGANNFVAKAFSVFVDMDEMVGKDFERGLEDLRRAAEGEVKRQREEQQKLENELAKANAPDPGASPPPAASP